MARESFSGHCLNHTGGNPYAALALAVRITRWKMIANLQIRADPGEPIPSEVRHARDRALRTAA